MRTFKKITLMKAHRTLNRAGLSKDIVEKIMDELRTDRHRYPNGIVSIRFNSKVKRRISEALQNDGRCGLMLDYTGKIRVYPAKSVEFKAFKELLGIKKKALDEKAEAVSIDSN